MLAVVGGTFAAHVLPKYLDDHAMTRLEVAVRALRTTPLAVRLRAVGRFEVAPRKAAAGGWLFVLGVVFFSGSLYVPHDRAKWLGAVALGGSSLSSAGRCWALALGVSAEAAKQTH
ncbi:MAG: DUF423 domain-containing protein [Phycisphaerales bacterium]